MLLRALYCMCLGSGSDPTESTYQPLEPSFYSRPPLQPGSTQYEQQQHQYGYYPVNQGRISSCFSFKAKISNMYKYATFPTTTSETSTLLFSLFQSFFVCTA